MTHQWLLFSGILFFIARLFISRLHKWLVQYDTKVDMKVYGDLILASARRGRVCGHCVCHQSKREFRNVTKITREKIRYISKLIRNFELTLPPIVDWDCTIYFKSEEKESEFMQYPYWYLMHEETAYVLLKKDQQPC